MMGAAYGAMNYTYVPIWMGLCELRMLPPS